MQNDDSSQNADQQTPMQENIPFAMAAFVKSATNLKNYPEPELPEVAVIGRSNVGKSSLLNSLFGRKSLVKVSRTPGRTQLINFFAIKDHLMLVDLPGYGFAKVPPKIQKQWRPMIETYLEKRENLVGCLLLLDLRRKPSEDDLMMWNWLRHFGHTTIPVLTKIDKCSSQQKSKQIQLIARTLDVPKEALVATSAKDHKGREQLRKTIQSLTWVEDDKEPLT